MSTQRAGHQQEQVKRKPMAQKLSRLTRSHHRPQRLLITVEGMLFSFLKISNQ